MNVLVIPEDFRKDQYILKPIVSAMLRALGRPQAKVRVCQDPLLGGIGEALNWEQIADILDRYRGMIDIFLLCVDRDGQAGREQQLRRLEENSRAGDTLLPGRILLAENAWQELEVWLLAGHNRLPADWVWNEVRAEIDPKEAYFLPFAQSRNLLDEPGQGRKTLSSEAAANYARIRQLCHEVAHLEARIEDFLNARQL